MTENDNYIFGTCLCGKAEFRVENDFEHFELCHSKQSQSLSGSAYRSNLYIDASKFRWTKGSGFVKRYRSREGNFSKAFCMECGSSMPLESQDGKTVRVPSGSLTAQPNIPPQKHIYWHERSTWLENIDTTETFEENSADHQTSFE